MEWNELLDKRYSIRSFSKEDVSTEKLTLIIQEALTTPSWGNSQPWRVYVAKKSTLNMIKKEYKKRMQEGVKGYAEMDVIAFEQWDDISKCNIVESVKALENGVGQENSYSVDSSQEELFNANAIIYITMPRNLSPWSIYDVGAFGQMILLSATAHGVGSIPAYVNVKYPDVIRNFANINKDEQIIMGIALGYPSKAKINTVKTNRNTISEKVVILE